MRQARWVVVAGHVLAVVAALAIGSAGAAKLASTPELIQNFARWGFPWWFVYVTGVLEVGGAVLILVPKTRIYGATVLAATMVGAIGTHLSAGETTEFVAPLVLGTIAGAAGVLAWQRQFPSLRGTP